MKKGLFFLVMFFSLGVFTTRTANAQVNINVNIASQPLWGPVGYDYVNYYYFPDIDAYYSIPQRQYIYLQGNKWVFANALPPSYHYDIYRGYKVVVNDRDPWLRPDYYRSKYGKYKNHFGKQVIIRDSDDPKYYKVNGRGNKGNNGNHGNPGKGNKGNHGNGKGHGHGH